MRMNLGMLGQYKAPFAIVSSGTLTSAGSTLNFTPTSTAIGDLVILVTGGVTPTLSGGSGSAWSYNDQTGGGSNIKTCYKVLQSGDEGATFVISSTPNNTPFAWIVYRGPTAMTLKESVAQGSGSTLDFTGFTPTNSTALAIGFSHGGGSATGIALTGWTTDITNTSFDAKSVLSTTSYFGGALSFTGVSGAVCGTLWEIT